MDVGLQPAHLAFHKVRKDQSYPGLDGQGGVSQFQCCKMVASGGHSVCGGSVTVPSLDPALPPGAGISGGREGREWADLGSNLAWKREEPGKGDLEGVGSSSNGMHWIKFSIPIPFPLLGHLSPEVLVYVQGDP